MAKGKKCEACGEIFFPKKGDYGKRWASRKFCSRGCRNTVYTNERPLAERFWEKVDKSGGPNACWPWTASTDTFGYGRIWDGERVDGSNRVTWKLTKGPIPEGEGHHGTEVLHSCDNPPCCNPSHLFLGSNADNLKDMVRKGRHGMAKITAKDAVLIREIYASGKFTQVELGEKFGISSGMVNFIINRKNWTHV